MTLFINVALLLLGMVLESIAILILVVPIIKPLAVSAGIDLVHLGVFMTVNLMIGMITPPVGLSLYVACEIAERPMHVIVKAVAPLLIPLLGALLIVSLVPATVTFLPRLLLD
jgi:TRAP-type C4-dicarboxylate transport system permease large subunit